MVPIAGYGASGKNSCFCAIFLRRAGVYNMMMGQVSTGMLRPERKMDHLGGQLC
jgi:hypothetical protein